MLRFQGADIEVALDEGFLFAGKRREPTHEIELELKAGEPAALFEFGLALVDALPLTRSVLSKAKRAAELLSGKPPEPVRSTSPALASDMPSEEAISVLFRSCFSQFLGNLPVLDRGDSIEAVHQMRVAMRRLRSAFGLVYRLSPSAEFDAFRAESKRIGTLLGQARDWDVFVQTIRGGPLPGFADATGFDKFISIAQSRAEAAHGAVARLANDRTVARFALRLDQFVALRGWRGDAQSDPPDWLSESVVEFAIKSLSRLHRRLLRRGKGFRSQSPGERHALRIAAKHMRYAVEFFGSLFHPHSAERYIDIAQVLQDLLGQQNDATIALGLVKTLDFGADAELEGRRIFPDLTVRDNLRLGGYSRPDADGVESDIGAMESFFPILAEKRDAKGSALSGGQQQMLAIARGLMAKPKILILDEPSLGLAPIIVHEVRSIILSVRNRFGAAVLLVEQNAALA